MDDPATNGALATPTAPRPRFSWPMRVFLFLLVFDMVFRGFSVMYDWREWLDELKMDALPRRLPTQAEIDELRPPEDSAGFNPAVEDVFRAFDGVWDFLRPWPGRETRAELRGPEAWGKWTLAWTLSRLEFAENVVGINQEWPMFSPNVGKKRDLTRARLTYADGSEREIRLTADPEDLTNYAHWFHEKILDYELHVADSPGRVPDCTGYCNLLAHRYPANAAGAKLVTISLFEVRYYYLPPDEEDPVAYLRAQSGPPADQIYPVYFIYDVATRKGTRPRDKQ
jgi:hypothetical protein